MGPKFRRTINFKWRIYNRGDTGVHAPRQHLIMRELCGICVVIAAWHIIL